MEKYDILLNEIKEYLQRPEVNKENTNNEVISLYDLYNIINRELEDLRNITINSKINKKLASIISHLLEYNFYSTLKCDEKNCKLIFTDLYSSGVVVYKDKGINDIYVKKQKTYRNKKIFAFIKVHHNLILETLTTAEEYVELFGSFSELASQSTSKNFKEDLFNVILTFYNNGEVEVDFSIIEENKLHEEYGKKWYKRQSICDFVSNHKEEILKRIPVSPYELEGAFKKIYDKRKEKTNDDQKVKTKRKIWL